MTWTCERPVSPDTWTCGSGSFRIYFASLPASTCERLALVAFPTPVTGVMCIPWPPPYLPPPPLAFMRSSYAARLPALQEPVPSLSLHLPPDSRPLQHTAIYITAVAFGLHIHCYALPIFSLPFAPPSYHPSYFSRFLC